MNDETDDLMLRHLRRLPSLEPDAARAEAIRARSRAIIARRRRRPAHSGWGGLTAPVLERALVGGLSLIYLSAVVQDVLRLHGIH